MSWALYVAFCCASFEGLMSVAFFALPGREHRSFRTPHCPASVIAPFLSVLYTR